MPGTVRSRSACYEHACRGATMNFPWERSCSHQSKTRAVIHIDSGAAVFCAHFLAESYLALSVGCRGE